MLSIRAAFVKRNKSNEYGRRVKQNSAPWFPDANIVVLTCIHSITKELESSTLAAQLNTKKEVCEPWVGEVFSFSMGHLSKLTTPAVTGPLCNPVIVREAPVSGECCAQIKTLGYLSSSASKRTYAQGQVTRVRSQDCLKPPYYSVHRVETVAGKATHDNRMVVARVGQPRRSCKGEW